jgi:hypothetical protein
MYHLVPHGTQGMKDARSKKAENWQKGIGRKALGTRGEFRPVIQHADTL